MEINYVPARIQKLEFCFCSFPKEVDADKCKYCSHPLFDEVYKSISDGKYSPGTEKILGPFSQLSMTENSNLSFIFCFHAGLARAPEFC